MKIDDESSVINQFDTMTGQLLLLDRNYPRKRGILPELTFHEVIIIRILWQQLLNILDLILMR